MTSIPTEGSWSRKSDDAGEYCALTSALTNSAATSILKKGTRDRRGKPGQIFPCIFWEPFIRRRKLASPGGATPITVKESFLDDARARLLSSSARPKESRRLEGIRTLLVANEEKSKLRHGATIT